MKCYEVKQGNKLFNYLIGSYGVYGFVYEVTLNIVENDKLKLYVKELNTSTGFGKFQELTSKLNSVEESLKQETHVKFIRIDYKLKTMKLHQYVHTGNVTSELTANAPTLSWTKSVIFHWFAHWDILKNLRLILEKFNGIRIDSVYKSEYEKLVDRNVFSYESQEQVSGKLTYLNATHVLQEFFVPFRDDIPYHFISQLITQFYNEKIGCDLLNVTARIVKKDEYPFILSYSPNEDMCAFVLYIRVGCDNSSISNLKEKQIYLNQYCLDRGGTFYLPYLHHYTKKQLLKSYPRILEFVKMKEKLDPDHRLSNEWYINIVKILGEELETYNHDINIDEIIAELTEVEFTSTELIFNIEGKKQDVVKTMMKSKHSINNFSLFLDHVFPLYNSKEVIDLLMKNSELDDKTLYINHLIPMFRSKMSIFHFLGFAYNANIALKIQLKEIETQIKNIVNSSNIRSILNIGDKGRYDILYKKLYPKSKRSYITFDWTLKERRCVVNEDMKNETRKHDIIFALAGLHHYNLEDLKKVLIHCQKTIKNNGYLILRDHDVTNEEDCNIVDAAHLIFNGLTGENHITEVNEMRYLRSKSGWINLLKSYGFESIFVENNNLVKIAKVQKHDPTRNIMMCFKYVKNDNIKNLFELEGGKVKQNIESAIQIPEWYNVLYSQKYSEFLIDYPWYSFPYMKAFYQMIDICQFVYNVERKNNTIFFGDIITAIFIILCHCISCIFSFIFAKIIKSFINENNVGGVRHVLVYNPNNADLKAKKLKQNELFLVEIPMYRPFTRIVKEWFELDDDISIKLISGNEKVWVDVRGELNKQTKWPIKTIGGLINDDDKINYVNINVDELRELFNFVETKENCYVMQIFQQ